MTKMISYFKIVTPSAGNTKMTDSQEMSDVGAYNNYTWYQRLIQGSASRMTRYREYDLMDNDVDVARALDTIAEEMTGNSASNDDPILVQVLNDDEDNVDSTAVLTVKAALRRWSTIHDWENRLFKVSRLTVKYGDLFFRKDPVDFTKPWTFIHPKNVVAAIVDSRNVQKILAWQVKKDIQKPRSGGYSLPLGAKQDSQMETEIIKNDEIIRFCINDDMSDTQPFGESVLRPVYRAHKQKELLEDAVIIYRIQRAPERRVFYIDVGKMPPHRVKQYLETIKNEIKQKKVPSFQGGQNQVDSVYNPQSMSEDFFFASRPDGRGSRVDTLPGGQGLGELDDLMFFMKKVWRGLRIPTSYMTDPAEGGQTWNDGKVGIAYIQELRFAIFCQRLQGYIEKSIDEEFKKFLRNANIQIDESMYRLVLPEPSNFGIYRQQELNSQLLSSFGSADAIPYWSKRFIQKTFMQLTDEQIITNERLLSEERGLNPDDGQKNLQQIYGPEMGVEGGGLGGGGLGGGMIGGGIGGEELGVAPGEEGTAGAPTGTPTGTPG